jgi:hypothetical protein
VNLSDAIAKVFPESERSAAAEAIDAYDGNERARVQVAILALAGGDMQHLRELVRAAELDYRDVLYWAEYPEESKSMPRDEAAARYRALGMPLPPALEDRPRHGKHGKGKPG